jgi:MFS family permease
MMSPFVGWLKDRKGTRIPTVYGYAILTPLIWFLGIPGSGLFSWADTKSRGPALYVLAMVLIGFNSSFLNAAGAIEATMAAKELAKEHPGAFGPGGGKSRALALSGMTYVLGSCAGPVLAGTLNEKFGYYVMNCVIGEQVQLSILCSMLTSYSIIVCFHLRCCIYLPSKEENRKCMKTVHDDSTNVISCSNSYTTMLI